MVRLHTCNFHASSFLEQWWHQHEVLQGKTFYKEGETFVGERVTLQKKSSLIFFTTWYSILPIFIADFMGFFPKQDNNFPLILPLVSAMPPLSIWIKTSVKVFKTWSPFVKTQKYCGTKLTPFSHLVSSNQR